MLAGFFDGVRMKILHVVPSFGLGGMERVLSSLINAFPAGIEQEVFVLNGEMEARKWVQQRNVHFLSFSRPAGNIRYWAALFRVLKEAVPSILMTYNWGATDAIWLGRLAGISNIFHSEHGFNVDEAHETNWKRDLIRYVVYRLTTSVIVVSQFLKKIMEHKYSLYSSRVSFIRNGIDTDFYSPDEYERKKYRVDLGFQTQDVVIGFSGRLDPVKNLILLMQVFGEVRKRNPRFKLLLIGDGPERTNLEEHSREYGLENVVLFVGNQSNVRPFLRVLDVFMLTSVREQMPMSMLEAMSVGVPVVASSVGEIPYMLDNQQAGFVCDLSQGTQPFGEALMALGEDQDRRRRGRSARELVLERFQEHDMIRSYWDLLGRI